MAYFLRWRKDVASEEDLEKTDVRSCGASINLQQVPQHLFNKLLDITINVALCKVTLCGCFPQESIYLVAILQSLSGNARLKMEILNLSGSVLTESSMSSLSYLIRNRKVSCLILTKCVGPENSMLTSKHKEMLKKAEKSTRRLFGQVRMVTIMWFDFVERLDCDIEDLDSSEWEIRDLSTSTSFLPGPIGKVERVAYYMIRHRMQSTWKLVSGRKRRHVTEQKTTSKVRIQEKEVDDLAKLMVDQSIGLPRRLETSPHGQGLRQSAGATQRDCKTLETSFMFAPETQQSAESIQGDQNTFFPTQTPSTTPSVQNQFPDDSTTWNPPKLQFTISQVMNHVQDPAQIPSSVNQEKATTDRKPVAQSNSTFLSARTAYVKINDSKVDVAANASERQKPRATEEKQSKRKRKKRRGRKR